MPVIHGPAAGRTESHDAGVDDFDGHIAFQIPKLISAGYRVTEIEADSHAGVCQDGTVFDNRTAIDAAVALDIAQASDQSIRLHFRCATDVRGRNNASATMDIGSCINPNPGTKLRAARACFAISFKNVHRESPQVAWMLKAVHIFPDEIFGRAIRTCFAKKAIEVTALRLLAIDYP